MTEQAIGYHFMLPDFKSRGQPSPRSTGPGRPCVGMNVRGILSQLGWIWDKFGTILIFYINIEHVFQLNILLKITFIAYKMEVDYSKKIPIKRPVEKKAVSSRLKNHMVPMVTWKTRKRADTFPDRQNIGSLII